MHDGVDTATFLLPCINWSDHGSGTYRYRNPSAPGGPSAVKAAKVKSGYLKVIGKGLGGMPVPNGDATIDVVLNLDGISRRFCMSFTSTGDGSRFVARDAPAGSCPSPPPCDAVTGGFCWFMGDSGASCDAACAIKGRAYDSATETYAGSGGTDANCVAVLDALGFGGPAFDELGVLRRRRMPLRAACGAGTLYRSANQFVRFGQRPACLRVSVGISPQRSADQVSPSASSAFLCGESAPKLISRTSEATRNGAAVTCRTSSTRTPGATSRSRKPSASMSNQARSVTTACTQPSAVGG